MEDYHELLKGYALNDKNYKFVEKFLWNEERLNERLRRLQI